MWLEQRMEMLGAWLLEMGLEQRMRMEMEMGSAPWR